MSFTFPDPNVTTEFTGDNGITYSWDAVDGKWQVKTTAALEDIRQDIIELEEEIEAIAPSVERGSWTFNDLGVITGTGIFTAYDKPIAQAGNPTGVVQSIQSVWIHSIDSAGKRHGFADVNPGQLLEIFVESNPDYGLFEVVEAHDYTDGAGDYWIIDVNFVQSLDNTTRFNGGNLCRLKIFQAPSGGDLSAYLPLAGGNMEGAVKFNPEPYNGLTVFGSDGKDYNNNSKIVFRAENGGTYTDPQVIIGVEPTGNTHATTKKYVDDKVKGIVGRYLLKDVGNNPISTDGEMGISTSFYVNVSQFSFGAKDSDGNATKVFANGDIIETYDPENDLNNRFKVTDASGAPTVVKVKFVSGNASFILDNVYQIQVHPGGEGEYVLKAGDNMEGALDMEGASGRNKILNLASPTSDYHAANKTYVDDKIGELLAKIEELEMTSGTTESIQFLMYNKTLGGSGSVGSQMFANDIMSCDNDGDLWNGQNTHLLGSEYRHIYICFEDGYQLNSTGQMSVVRYSNSNQYDIRNSNVATFNVSGVEVCPPDKSSGKNIYRAVIQLDAYKPGTDAFYPSWGQGNVYVTFSGGSLTQTSA